MCYDCLRLVDILTHILCGDGGLRLLIKQKTAYEMRISDWSSDVCSSDLRHLRPARPVPPGDRLSQGDLRGHPEPVPVLLEREEVGLTSTCTGAASGEIGRASCRERVGQYV